MASARDEAAWRPGRRLGRKRTRSPCTGDGGLVARESPRPALDARLGSPPLLAREPPGDDAHDGGDGNRQDGDDEQSNHRYLNLNSTATSTMTSTGVPCRRAGEKRHWRTACTARSFKSAAEPLDDLQIADRAVPPDDDFQDDFARRACRRRASSV